MRQAKRPTKLHKNLKFPVFVNFALGLFLFAASTVHAAYDRDMPMLQTSNGDIEIAYQRIFSSDDGSAATTDCSIRI